MRDVIEMKFPDDEYRMALLEMLRPEVLGVEDIYVNISGISLEDARHIVRRSIQQGKRPEVLRLANMMARTFFTG